MESFVTNHYFTYDKNDWFQSLFQEEKNSNFENIIAKLFYIFFEISPPMPTPTHSNFA